MASPAQRILPGMPPPADDPAVAEIRRVNPLDAAEASLDRLADIHRRMDELAGRRKP
jgi:hypothetical protein